MLLEAAREMLATQVKGEMAGSLRRWVGLTRSKGGVDHGRRGGSMQTPCRWDISASGSPRGAWLMPFLLPVKELRASVRGKI